MPARNVLLTGLPRAGTSLACRLLNALPHTFALDEPLDPAPFVGAAPAAAVTTVERCFARSRRSIASDGVAVSMQARGAVGENHYRGGAAVAIRAPAVTRDTVRVNADASTLVIKHPAIFTAYLPLLAQRLECYALVRNPLAVLASWNTIDAHVRDGRLPVAEAADSALAAALETADDRIERQLTLLSWFFDRYAIYLPTDAILRYEDVVATGGAALAAVVPAAAAFAEPLDDRNASYDPVLLRCLAGRLLASEGAYWDLYTRENVEALR